MKGNANRKPISVLGLRIERKTDLLAAAAFILAAAGAIFQSVSFIRGAEIKVFPPQTVTLFLDPYPNGDTFIRIAANMSYVNQGEAAYGATIERESVAFTLAKQTYVQTWHSFQRLGRKGLLLDFNLIGAAQPVPVPGATSISNATVFAPYMVRCKGTSSPCNPNENFLSLATFLKASDGTESLDLEFRANIVGRKSPLVTRCTVDLDNSLVAILLLNRWYTASCWPTSDS
jgi:hypothetical protein